MKTNGLRNKKPATVRACIRAWKRRQQRRWEAIGVRRRKPWRPIDNWHRAAKGRK